MAALFDLGPRPALSVAGNGDYFPVGRIFCVGRNYLAHAIEMGAKNPEREAPFFFAKFPEALVPGGGEIPYPSLTADFHHEAELVVAIGRGGYEIPQTQAEDHVFGYAVGIDLTRRDLQTEFRNTGRPWELSKAFDFSAPCSAIHPASAIGHLRHARLTLSVNGKTRQDGDIADMVWKVAEIVEYLSRAQRLEPGDLIFTGTPAGVGPLVRGDKAIGALESVGEVAIAVV